MKALKLGCIALLLAVLGAAAQSPSHASFPKPGYSELPTYPERARAAHVAGAVKLWFMSNVDGEVTQSGVISGNSMLRESAMSAVKSWKFKPNVLRPDARHETEFTYVLNVQPTEGEPKLTVSMTDYRRVEVVSELYVKPIE